MKRLTIILAVIAAVCMGLSSCDSKVKPDTGKTVPTSGGTVEIGGVTIDIPDGALETPVKIEAKTGDVLSLAARPFGSLAMVKFGPDGTKFLKPIKVTLPLERKTKDAKLMVYYYNEDAGVWSAAADAAVVGSNAVFEISHFSLYSVGGHYDYVADGMDELMNEVNDGLSDAAIFAQFKSKIDSRLEDLFSWDIIGGCYYRVGSYSENYMYSKDSGKKEGQGTYRIGNTTANWQGYYDNTNLYYRYMSDSGSFEKTDYNTFQKELQEGNEAYSDSFERELHLVPSAMTATIDGKLEKKGDQATIHFKLAAKTTGQKVQYKVVHSCVGLSSGYRDETPNGSYDRIVELPYDDPSLGENPPIAYQKLKVSVSDTKAFKLSKEEIETDIEGEATVTVTALKDAPEGDIKATFDYTSNVGKEPEKDHSDASIHVGSKTWYITGILSDNRAASSAGVTASADIAFDITFDLSKTEQIAAPFGTITGVYTTFNMVSSNVSISNGSRDFGQYVGLAEYEISGIKPKSYKNQRGFVDLSLFESRGICNVFCYDPAVLEPTAIAEYTIQTTMIGDKGPFDQWTDDDTWDGIVQISLPLVPGSYSPLLIWGDNIQKCQTDNKNLYIGVARTF